MIGSFQLWPTKINQGTLYAPASNRCSLTVGFFHVCDFFSRILTAEFGEKEVSILTAHYEPLLEAANVEIDEVDTEWSMLKLEIYAR